MLHGCQKLCQSGFDSGSFAFHVHRVNQKFVAVGGEFFQDRPINGNVCEFLPPVCNNIVFAVSFSAAQIQDQMFFADGTDQLMEMIIRDLAVFEYIGSDNDMAGACI